MTPSPMLLRVTARRSFSAASSASARLRSVMSRVTERIQISSSKLILSEDQSMVSSRPSFILKVTSWLRISESSAIHLTILSRSSVNAHMPRSIAVLPMTSWRE